MMRPVLSVLIILAIVVAGLGCSSGDNKPTSTPVVVVVTATAAPAAETPRPSAMGSPTPEAKPTAASTSRKVEAQPLAYRMGSSGASGVVGRLRVSVEKNTGARELAVGVFEDEVAGAGPMWRASAWMSVIMSSLLLGIDPMDYRFSYDAHGWVDGPSASTLTTVTTMAALLGHDLKPEVTMTGIINPDGTVGPVGGIPHKIDGAAGAGKKLVLIPAGQRQDYDTNLKRNVDVVDRGRSKNVEVKEVADVYEAYELLTGKPLPKAQGMKEIRPELPSNSFERVRAKSKEWYTRYWQIDSQYAALPSQVKVQGFNKMMQEAKAHGDKSDSYYNQGLPSAAYAQALQATLNASVGFHAAKVVEAWMNGGTRGAAAYMDSMQSVKLKNDAFLDRLQTQTPKTLGDVIAISDAYGYSSLAMGLVDLGNAAVNRKTKNEEETVTALAEAALYYAVAEHAVELGKDALDIGLGYGKAPLPPREKIDAVAELLRRAADANLNYFNTVVLDEVAAGAGVHLDVVKASFGGKDMMYTFATSAINVIPVLKQRAGGGPAGSYAVLGSALNSYAYSSVLLAKWYSLGAQLDKDGNVKGISNERAMINMLDFAEKRARELVGLAVSLEAEPVQPVLYFDNAKVSREGEVDDKLSALELYWRTSLEGQIMGMLSGKTKLVN